MMIANRSFFATLALAFALVLVGAACTETASNRAADGETTTDGGLAVEAPAIEEAPAEEAAPAAAEEARVITVTMSEFALEPGTIGVVAGETVTFVVTNAGVVEHEFRLSNEHRIEEHIAATHAGHADGDDAAHHDYGDMVLLLGAGESGEMTVTFPDDATVYTNTACLIPGHYEAGMGGEVSYNA